MKELQKQFIGRGETSNFLFTQLKATNKAYLYKVDVFGKIHFEVFKRRVNTRFEEKYVSYPTSKGFGIWAWTTKDYDKALNYFNQYNEGGSHE